MNKLIRSRSERKFAGILGGFAQYLGIDPTLIRVIFIIALLVTGFFPLAFVYFILVFFIPNEAN